MPRKPSDRDKLREDVSETAYRTLQEAIGERPKTPPAGQRTPEQRNPEAVKRGRKGGKKGGRARAKKLSSDHRSEIAKKVALVRWKKGPQM